MRKISTDKAPAAIGPYSQAIIAGDFLYASGQIPINPATGNVDATGITEQAEQSMKNVGAILNEAGVTYDNVVKTTCFFGRNR
jgi:2-iminobutanoate/2-iminopropanoate deaminase